MNTANKFLKETGAQGAIKEGSFYQIIFESGAKQLVNGEKKSPLFESREYIGDNIYLLESVNNSIYSVFFNTVSFEYSIEFKTAEKLIGNLYFLHNGGLEDTRGRIFNLNNFKVSEIVSFEKCFKISECFYILTFRNSIKILKDKEMKISKSFKSIDYKKAEDNLLLLTMTDERKYFVNLSTFKKSEKFMFEKYKHIKDFYVLKSKNKWKFLDTKNLKTSNWMTFESFKVSKNGEIILLSIHGTKALLNKETLTAGLWQYPN